jgi:hypothetical protein
MDLGHTDYERVLKVPDGLIDVTVVLHVQELLVVPVFEFVAGYLVNAICGGVVPEWGEKLKHNKLFVKHKPQDHERAFLKKARTPGPAIPLIDLS